MDLFYTDVFVLPLPAGHRFPMEKYARLRAELLAGGDFSASDFHLPHPASDEELARAHDPDYIRQVCCGQLPETAQKAIGFPWSPGMVERSRCWSAGHRQTSPAAPTMPSAIVARDSASSTMPPSPPVPCRPKVAPSGC